MAAIVRIVGTTGEKSFAPARGVAAELADYAMLCALSYESPSPVTATDYRGSARWTASSALNHIVAKVIPGPAPWVRVWQRTDDGTDIVIVFRGTAVLPDWVSNFNWVLGRRLPGIFRDKYTTLEVLTLELQEAIQHSFPGRRVVTAGHSLGGGLAQFYAYRAEGVQAVYAFNSSPVTGFFAVPRWRRRTRTQALEIFRIHEKGEALAFIRGPIKLLRRFFRRPDSNISIVEYTFNFDSAKWIRLVATLPFRLFRQHSIDSFAKSLLSCVHCNRLAPTTKK